MKQLIRRFVSESPTFFRKAQRIGIAIAGCGTVIVTTKANFGQYSHLFKPWVDTAAGYMIVGGIIIAGMAKMTVSDVSDLDKPVSQIMEEKKNKNL